jgi:hypothetical protein
MPVTANGLEEVMQSDSSIASICCPRRFFIILHTRKLCRTLLTFWRALKIQNSLRSWDNMLRTPKWCNRMWDCRISNAVKQWATSSSSKCCWSLVRSAHCSRSPKRLSPFFQKWVKMCYFGPSW